MHIISVEESNEELNNALDKVNSNHKPIFLTRSEGKTGVLISLEDFHAYQEALYLLEASSEENAEEELKK